MATPTLTNLNAAETYRTAEVDLTDMVVSGTGTIAILLSINPAAGTLAYLSGSTGNVTLGDLGFGLYQLSGDAAELTASLANLAYTPAAGFLGTFDMQVQAENAEGEVAGVKTVSFDLADGDALALGDGTDEVFLLKSLIGSATVDAGTGQDTLRVQGSDALSIDFSQGGQQVTDGSPNVVYSGFENLDAADASGVMTVTAGSSGGSIVTGTGNDSVTLGAGVDQVNTGDGNDVVSGSWTSGDNIALGEGDDQIAFSDVDATVNAGGGVDTLVVTGSDALRLEMHIAANNTPDAAARLSNFENLDASGASGNLEVSLAAGSTSVRTGSGDDTIAFRDVVASVNAGTGSDTLQLDVDKLSAPAASTALTINLAAAANTNQIIAGAPANASWQNFENLDGSAWDKNLTVTANAAGGAIATGSGADSVTLGAGADQVSTGDGADRITGAIGAADDIDLGAGRDTATFATSASGVVDGGNDADTLLYTGGAVTINLATNTHFTHFENLSASGATGIVTFTGVAGTTSVVTGSANDVINVAAATAGVTINAGAGNNKITGGSGNDVITLSSGTDNIRGGNGNDTIRGNLSVGDVVLLDGGNDSITLPTTAIAVTVDGGTGSDTLIVRGSAARTFNFAGADDNGTQAGSYKNFENVSGSSATGALTVTGVAATTLVITGSGNDVINVAAAAQSVTINAGKGTNTVTGSAFADTITLGTGKDIINAGNGADTVIGNLTTGDQVLLQGSADTFLYRALTASGTVVDGGTGIDTLQYTGSTAKTFKFSSATDNVAAETGLYKAFENLDASTATGAVTVTSATTTTRILTGSGADIITATNASGGVRVDAGAGNDRITTGSGADTIVYGSGSDTVDAGTGIDKLEIGAGAGELAINLALTGANDQVDSVSVYRNFENVDGTHADGNLNVTLGAQTTSVVTGSGDDTVHTGTLTTFSGTLALGAGDDSVVVDTTNTNLSAATLSGVEHLGLGNNVDATLSIAQNALLDSAAGTNTVTLSAAGFASGKADVETYRLANGFNDFTLGSAGQNVTGGTGNDTVHSDALTTLSGTLALGAGTDTLIIATTDTDISAATLSSVEAIALANDVNATMTRAQNALLGTAAGTNTVTLTDAGTGSGGAQVETYHLADGANSFTLGAAAQNVTGGSGDDSLKSGSLSTISGTLDGVSGEDTLLIESDATLNATLTNIDGVMLASGVDVTTNIATANLITVATGINSVTLTNAGVLTGVADVESYFLADGGNDFTLSAAGQNVTGGSGDDVFNSDTLTSLTGTLTGGGGNDVLNIQGSTLLSATLVDIDTISIATNVDLTTIIADNALIGSAAGSNIVTLIDAGTLTGAAEIEAYRLADGGNTFTLGNADQSVIGGSGDDVVATGPFTTVTGTYTLDGGNDDSVVIDTNNTNLSGATLVAVEHVNLVSNVNATVSLAQNALITSAVGDNTVTLSAAGTASGALAVEHYVLADGANAFTVVTAGQSVTGGSGDDVVHSGALISLANTLSLGGGNDTLVVDTTGTNIAAMSLTSVEHIELANNVSATMSIAENALLDVATGTNTVTLAAAGTASGVAVVENYQLANGANSFTLGAAGQNVSGGSGDDIINTGALTTVSGNLNGGSGSDNVVVETSATLSATLTNIDAVKLATDVNLTTTIANNALITNAIGSNTVTLSEAGTASGAAQVENYVLADGSNSFTLGAAAQNVTGGSGDDIVHSGALSAVSGTLALGGGNDTLIIDTTGTNISAATLTAVEAVELANNVSITSNIANNALLGTAAGSNTVTLSEAGSASGAAEVENYVLANGSNAFTLAAAAQNVTGGTGDDSLDSGTQVTVSGTLDGVSGNDTLNIAQSATLSATLNNIDAVTLANNVNLTTTIANNALITSALGTNTVTLSEAGTASGAAEVENYVLANGANTFTLGASTQNVTGGNADDVINTGALATVSGTLDGVSGNDTVAVEQSATLSATLNNIDAVTLANNVNLTTSLANNALITSALGTNTVTLSAAGTASGAAEVESYVLANGANTFTLGAAAQNVTGGSGDDSLKTGALTTVSGSLDGVSGNDTLAVEQSALLSATLTNIDAVTLANNVNLTTSIANNALISTATGSNTVTLSNAGTASGAAEVENYQLADGANTFTLGAAAQNVTGGSGDDVVHTGSFTTLTGTLALAGGADSVVIDTTATNIAGATLTGVESLQLANNVDATMSIAQHGLLSSAAGTNTVTLSDAGTVTGMAEVEAYRLANGANTFTLGANGQDVTGGTGADVINVIDTQLSGAVLDGGGARDTLVVSSSAGGVSTIGGTLSNIEVIDLTGVANGANFTGGSAVDDVRGGAGADTLNVAASVAAVTITAGTGADVITGSGNNDVIDVGVDSDADTVNAGGGSDTVINFGAGDSINFEGGADTVTYAAVTATVDGGSAVDTLTVTATTGAMTFDFSQTNAQQITAGGTGLYRNFENLAAGGAGVTHALTVTMASTTTAVTTGAGDDTITYRNQAVAVDAGSGADTLILGGSGVIVVDLSAAGDQVSGTGSYVGFENLDGAASGATLVAIAGETTSFIRTGSGNDSLSGGVSLDGGAGNNNITADARTTTVVAGSGNDNLDASAAAQAVTANLGDGANAVIGSNFDDIITLGAGADTINAGAGSDVIIGAVTAGDTVNLGADADSFTYQALSGAGSVVDADADSDTLVVNAGGSALTIDFSNTNDQIAAETGSYRNFENLAAGNATVNLTVTTGSGGALVVTGSGDDDVTVSAANDDVSTGAGDDIINVTAATLNSAIDAGGNTGVGDTLNVLGGGTLGMSVTAVGIENVSLAVATNFTANALSGLRITGSAGDDTITVGAGDQVIDGAAGNDVIKVSDALFSGSLVVDGGADTSGDTLQITTDATIVDSDFAQVSHIETLQLAADAVDDAQSVTVGSAAVTGGLTTIDATSAGANDQIVVDASGFTAALTINTGAAADTITLGSGGSTVDAGNGDNTVTVGAANDGAQNDTLTTGSGDDHFLTSDAQLTANLSIVAGGGSDTLEVSTAATIVDADLAGLGSIEQLLLGADAVGNAQSVTLGVNAASAGFTTVAMLDNTVSDAITVDASAFNNALSIHTGAGDDVITLGSGGSVVDAQGGNNIITVGAANDAGQHDDITTLGGDDRILVSDAQLTQFLSVAAGAGLDTLEVTSDAAIVDADLAGLHALDVLELSADAVDNAQSVTLGALASAAGFSIVDATGVGANDAVTVNASAFSTALTINTADGFDVIQLGSGGSTVSTGDGDDLVFGGSHNDGTVNDSIATGSGDDSIQMESLFFTANLALDGGADVDTLLLDNDVTVGDAAFTQVSNVEALTLLADAQGNLHQVTLGSAASASGLHTVNTTTIGNDDELRLDARDFSNVLNINSGASVDIIQLGSGGSVVNAGSGANVITVGAVNDGATDDIIFSGAGDDLIRATDSQFTSHLSVNAGSGSDTLEVTTDATVIDADFTQLSSVETLKLSADASDNAQSVVLGANAGSAGLNAVDASSVGANDAVNINASAFLNALTIDTAAGNDVITLGVGGSVVVAGDGNNSVTLGADNDGVHDDDVSTGVGADNIFATDAQVTANLTLNTGAGIDALIVTTAASISDVDTTGLSNLEILELVADAAGNVQSVTLAGIASDAGITTIDATGIGADDALTVDATGFTPALTVISAASSDVVRLGAGGSIVSSGDSDDLVVSGAANDGSVNDSIDLGTGNDAIEIASDTFTEHLTLDGGEDFDELRVTGDVTVVDADFIQVSSVEKIVVGSDSTINQHTLTVGSAAAASGLAFINTTTAGSNDAVTVDAHDFANALSIDTGDGDDVITLGAGGSAVQAGDGANTVVVGADNDGVHNDSITTGAGNDVIKSTDARFSDELIVTAGGGTDILEVTDDAAVADAAFTQIASVEVLKLSADAVDNAQSVVLANHAATAGITALNAAALGADDALTVDASGFANALTINSAAGDDTITLGSGGSVVNAGRGDNVIFVGADNDGVHDDHITTGADHDVVNLGDAQLSANFTFSAGGGSDEVRITSDASVVDADLAGLTSVEVLSLVVDAGDDGQSVVLGANAEAAGITTVDGSGIISTDVLTIDASAFSHGLTVNTSLGDDLVTLGSGGSLVSTSDGVDTIIVGAANDGDHNDDILAGDGNDVIKTTDAQLSVNLSAAGGDGIDTLEVTTDASVTDADLGGLRTIERLVLSADAGDDAQSLTLGSHALAMGLNTVDTSGPGAGVDDSITIDASAFSGVLSISTGAGDDTITLGTGGSTVTTGLGDDNVTAGAAGDDIASGGGDDVINVTRTTIAADIDGGANTGAGDTLRVTGGGAVLMGSSVINVENVVLDSATDFIANGISALHISGSASDDIIHVGAGDQVIASAAGDDIIDVDDSLLTASLVVDGGAHVNGDILNIRTDASVADADLANISNVEILKLGTDAADFVQTVVFAANAAAAGFTHIDSTAVGAGQTINIDATAFANGLTMDGGDGSEVALLGAGGSVVNAGAGADRITVGAANDGVHDDVIHLGNSSDVVEITDAQLSSHLTVSGDGGTDRLQVNDDASIADADLAGITSLEVLVLKGDAVDNGQSITLAANAVSAGIDTIDAIDVGNTDALTIDASAFTQQLHITTSGGDDDIVLGSGGSVVNAGAGDNTVTVGASNDNIITGDGDDLIKVGNAQLGAQLAVSAANGSDTLEVMDDADIDAGDLAGVSGIDVLKLSGNAADNSQAVFFDDSSRPAEITTIDATAVHSSDDLALNFAGVSAALTINSGASLDVIFLGSGGSVVSSGAGNDVITVGAANDGVLDDHIAAGDGNDQVLVLASQLSSHLEVDGGNDLDGLYFNSDIAVVDADFTLMSNLEQLVFHFDAVDNAQSITVAALAAAAGVNRIDGRFAGSDDVFTVDASGFANALTIETNNAGDAIVLGSGGSVVNAHDGDNVITIGAVNDGVQDDSITTGSGADLFNVSNAQLTAHLTIAAGGGVDVLNVTSDADVVDADFTQLGSVEVFRFGVDAGDEAQSVVLASNAMAAGLNTVDISLAGVSDSVTVDASAYTTNLTVILHGGIDDVTLGSGNDTLIGGVSAGDSINLGAGNDSFAITTLAAVTIDGGIDLDTLVIGVGAGSRQIDFSNAIDQLSGAGTYLNFENLAAGDANGQLSVIAGDGTTSIVTGSKIDQVDAGFADQGVTIATGASGDAIIGSAHNDSIDGGAGDDSIAGGAGNDALTGGAGSDTFVFDNALNASTNVDTLSDFVSGSDVFQLNLDIFTALESTDGVLNANNFRAAAGAVATSATQHIILDTTSGSLFYDADGVGGVAQIEFARLSGAHTAVATDFVIG